MRRTFTTLTALTAALALAACNGDSSSNDTETAADTPTVETTDESTETADDAAETTATDEAGETAAAGGMTDPVCAEFFETQGTPLSERAQEQLDVVGAGDDLDPVSYSEVSLLNNRITLLQEDADGEHADLLERINAPFDEVVDAVVAEDTRLEDEIAIPAVDTADAEAALEEFETACAG